MDVVDRGTVFRPAKGSDCQSCTFSSIAVLPSGRWYCTFRAAPNKVPNASQRPLFTWSDDQGGSWSTPVAPLAAPPIDGRPGWLRTAAVTALADGTLLAALCWIDRSNPARPLFNPQTEGLLEARIFLARSVDEGQTWSPPQRLLTPAFAVPTPTTGPVLQLANGNLACQFELNKHYHDTRPWQHASVLVFSADGGATWPEHSVVADDPSGRFYYWDQRPGVLADGSVLDLFWTYDNVESKYLDIHARRSFDCGRCWSPLWDVGVPGQPAQPVSLADGRLAMVYVDRTAAPAIKLRTSADAGRSWPATSEMVLYGSATRSQSVGKASMRDCWAEMSQFSVGLPATTLTAAGDLLLVYYAGSETDHTAIHWVRLSRRRGRP